jgi:hypothetical protein
MEKDVDLIVAIEPGEAQMLIGLIEMLFDEWYVERDKRIKRLAEITKLSAQKSSELAELKIAKLGDVRGLAGDPSPLAPGLKYMSAADPEHVAFACPA